MLWMRAADSTHSLTVAVSRKIRSGLVSFAELRLSEKLPQTPQALLLRLLSLLLTPIQDHVVKSKF